MLETLEDKELIKKYLKGEARAFDFLVEKNLKLIYNFVYKNVGNEASAEDITQEVFLKVFNNIKKIKNQSSFRSWIFNIAKNTSLDYLKKKKAIPFSRFENENGKN